MADIKTLAVSADSEYLERLQSQLLARGAVRILTAETVEAAASLLTSTDSIDCIVSDHDLPDTDGLAFLGTVRAQAPTLPFILFASEGSETIASRAISADVTEYLIKERYRDQWDRLSTLIRDAVGYYRMHGELDDPDTRTKAVLNAARESIAIVRDGRYVFLNQAGTDVFDRDARHVRGRQVTNTIEPVGDETSIADHLAAIQAGNRTLDRIEATVIQPDGATTPVEVTATLIDWNDGPATVLVIRSIAERKAREQELKVTIDAIDEAPVGITLADATEPDNPLIYANEAFQQLTGHSETDLLGRNCRFLQGEGTDPEPVAAMRAAIDDREPATVELRNYRKDGSEFWNRVTVAPIENEAGEVSHFVGFQQEVTERKEYEFSLRRFRRAVEAAGHAIYITDTDGTIAYVNPAFEHVTGYTGDQAIGRTPSILESGEQSADHYRGLWETLLDGEVWNEEVVNERRSGELYHARQTIAPITDETGEVDAFVAIQRDVTAQKEREAQLRHYERAIESANDLIAAIDTDRRYLFANERYRQYHGPSDLDPIGVRTDEYHDEETWQEIEPYVERALAGETVHYQMTRSRTDRPSRVLDIQYYPFTSETDDDVQGVVATMRDITEQEERGRQLAVLSRVRRHNFRTAINIITGNAERVVTETGGPSREAAGTIIETGRELLELANREREIVELISEPDPIQKLELVASVRRVLGQFQEQYPAVDFEVDLPGECHVAAIPQLEQAIAEVVENAIEHNEREAPSIEVTAEPNANRVDLQIIDGGPGIPQQDRTILLGDHAIDPLYHGSGLGLWLVSWIVNRSGGTITYDERTPSGSIVRITLQQQIPEAMFMDEVRPDDDTDERGVPSWK